MVVPYSPSVRRRRLSSELRRLRAESGLNLVEAAKRAGMGKSNLSKIEQAESRTVPTATLDKLLDLYEVDDSSVRDSLHELSKLAGQKGWWSSYKDVMPQMLTDFEAEASTFRTYESQVIPGLLQTPQYADAIFRANLVRNDDEIARRVEARIKRQSVLNGVDPPTFMALIDESALRRMVGTSDVMREQLRHLTHMASHHNIHIYVLPFSTGAHPSTEGSYVIMDFPDPRDSSIAYLETPATSMYLEEEHQVRLFNDMFGSTQSCAMPPVESLTFIGRLLQDPEK